MNPERCKYRLVAIGPLFGEQKTAEKHRFYRDIVAPLESQLAYHLRNKGYEILGKHPKLRPYDEGLFSEVLRLLKHELQA